MSEQSTRNVDEFSNRFSKKDVSQEEPKSEELFKPIRRIIHLDTDDEGPIDNISRDTPIDYPREKEKFHGAEKPSKKDNDPFPRKVDLSFISDEDDDTQTEDIHPIPKLKPTPAYKTPTSKVPVINKLAKPVKKAVDRIDKPSPKPKPKVDKTAESVRPPTGEKGRPPGDRIESPSLENDDANIDMTGEKARLMSIKRLDTPEGMSSLRAVDGDSPSSSSIPVPPDEAYTFLPRRYIMAIMIFMGFVNMYAIRVNLNVAIGAMVNNHTIVQNGEAIQMPPEFNWSSKLQGIVLGSFYYGYMILQIPGGYFAMKYGGTKIFGGAIAIASVLMLFTPVATRRSVWALVVLRIFEGLVLGVMLPCNHQIWSLWAPLQERTTLVTIALAGMNVGTVVTMPLTGLLTKYGFDGGWASVFYCFGLFGVIWYILWFLIIHPSPESHPTISDSERKYIQRNTIIRKSQKVPWGAIFTSRPVLAVVIGNIANDWGLYMILICLPLFLMDIMKFNVQTMGFVASLPFLLKALVGPLGGVIADIMRHKYFSTANVRRIFYVTGAMSAACLIVIAGYSHTPSVAVFSMCIGVALSGLLHSGYEVNVLDIAPSLSGIVMGISNTAGTTTGFLSPLLVGYMTENKLRSEWNRVFWITFGVYAVGSALYCLLLSGDVQHWAKDDNESDNEMERGRIGQTK